MSVNPQALRTALENSLAENPDDLATIMAYADLLSEQNDPRGEFIHVQLRLEEERLPAAERRKLVSREKQLLKKHEREWLGPLAEYLIDKSIEDISHEYGFHDEQTFAHGWRRGFLHRVEVHWLTGLLAHTLVDAQAARYLRELVVHGELSEDDQVDPPESRVKLPRGVRHSAELELLGAPFLSHLRVFQMGNESGGEEGWTDCHGYNPNIDLLVAQMPRLEELILLTKGYSTRKLFALPNLTHLRVLQCEHLEEYHVNVLAKNAALSNLTHLWFHPHFHTDIEYGEEDSTNGYLPLSQLRALVRSPHLKMLTHLRFRLSSAGDEGVRLLIKSGFLGQLQLLDLRHGCVTDAGAKLLAEYPDLKKLELLDLSRNQLTGEGIALLRATGVNLRCDDQHPVGSHEYLTEGDFE